MPKLPSNIQKAAENSEVQDFSAIPGGLYRVRVAEIETDATSAAGNPKWVFKVKVEAGPNDLGDESHKNRTLFEHCALTEEAAWKLKSIFTALGYTMDSDADELIGDVCLVQVSQTEIASGNRKGQTGNNIDAWLADVDGGEELVSAGAAKKGRGGKKGDEDF